MKIILLILATFFGSSAYAFNSAACKRYQSSMKKKLAGDEDHFLTFTTVAGTTSAQTTSSWGKCALIGLNQSKEVKRKEFIAVMEEEIKIESAIGKGETLSALSELYGCENEDLSKELKRNFKRIFKNSESSDYEIDKAALKVCEIKTALKSFLMRSRTT
jgi:hypothetical protein